MEQGIGLGGHYYFYEADYLMQFLLREYGDDLCSNFQSMVATIGYDNHADRSSELKTRKELYSYVTYICREMLKQSDLEIIADIDKTLLNHLLGCVGKMIGNEMLISRDGGYYVFYRSVRENIILYEFHTLMLRLFAENKDYWSLGSSSRDDEPAPLICTANIIESDYNKNLEYIIDQYRTEGEHFSECADILLSGNFCMDPQDDDIQNHKAEASPLIFYRGYQLEPTWKHKIGKFLQQFFNVNETMANEVIAAMGDVYRKNQRSDNMDSANTLTPFNKKAGHLIQICIPRNVADQFVYTAVEYGDPATVYVLDNGDHVGRSLFDKPPPDAVRQLTFHEIMSSPYMAKLQPRILAHPNLFLCHGAFTNVVSANPLFNRKTFQDDLLRLLHPLILQSQMQGKHLHFDQYTVLPPKYHVGVPLGQNAYGVKNY